jgi:hypothetical protein
VAVQSQSGLVVAAEVALIQKTYDRQAVSSTGPNSRAQPPAGVAQVLVMTRLAVMRTRMSPIAWVGLTGVTSAVQVAPSSAPDAWYAAGIGAPLFDPL